MWFAVLAGPALAGTIPVDLGRGPVPVHVPDTGDPAVPLPLVVNLHGYTGSGDENEAYMRFARLVDEVGFVYTTPTGRVDFWGENYWSGTDYCCGEGVDSVDVSYLNDLVDAISAEVAIDPARIYLVGHSNGGFMSYRLACDVSDRFAAIASLAGATWDDPSACSPTEPVSVLQIHGTRDDVIQWDGGCFFWTCYPGAIETVRTWAHYNGCEGRPVEGLSLDLDWFKAGAETRTFSVEGCPEGGAVDLWAMVGSGHVPLLTDNWAERVMDWLLSHPKP